jgi:hypothetical protein
MLSINDKTFCKKTNIKMTLLIILPLFILFSNIAVSQNVSLSELSPKKYALQNLKAAVFSKLLGLKDLLFI